MPRKLKHETVMNLTQHSLTIPQKAGLMDMGIEEVLNSGLVPQLLTFNDLPSKAEMQERARTLALLCKKAKAKFAIIGGAPYFMSYLEAALKKERIRPLYAFSRRESVEKEENGEVMKTSVFKHVGFIEA